MNIVLLSGGSGKRLWPLSNDIRSKQFIKMFKTADGEYESMVQRVYNQIRAVDTDATVTLCHSKTMNIKEITQNADVIVSAVGNKEYFTLDHVNQEKMVRIIDVGINFNENGKLCGDIPKSAIGPRTFVTPVPGGVGLLTTASLMHNVIKLHARF
jgi:5,10-methylene-tetrahydrofolate dehydrogenase/methenyl tetrahydrofolate cyclohydrolase